MEQQDDLDYINRILLGDVSAFSYMVEKYKEMAYTLALRIVKNEEDAEEVAQDAFLKVYKSIGKFKKESSFSTWLFRIVYNTALSKIRKKKVEVVGLNESYHHLKVDETRSAFGMLVIEDRKKYLEYAINQLSEDEATLINLHYLQELKTEEISGVMKLSHGNVRVKLMRARKKLHTYLEKILKKEQGGIL